MPYPPTSEPTISHASPVTASLVGPIPVPTHGPGGNFAILAKTRIASPPSVVLSLIRNTGTWADWNTFCPRCVFSSTTVGPAAVPSSSSLSDRNPSSAAAQTVGGEGEGEEGVVLDECLRGGREGWLEKGSVCTIDVFMDGDGLVPGRKRSRTQGLVITRLEKIDDLLGQDGAPRKGFRLAWKSTGWSHWQLHSERVMDFIETEINGKTGTDYTCWETFGGVLAVAVKAAVGSTLVERFGDYARDVKGFLEGKDAGARGSSSI